MEFLWNSYGIPMEFLWNSHGFPWIPMNSHEFPRNFYGLPMDSYGPRMRHVSTTLYDGLSNNLRYVGGK